MYNVSSWDTSSPPTTDKQPTADRHRREIVTVFAETAMLLLRNKWPVLKVAIDLLPLVVISCGQSDEWPAL